MSTPLPYLQGKLCLLPAKTARSTGDTVSHGTATTYVTDEAVIVRLEDLLELAERDPDTYLDRVIDEVWGPVL